jgi:hypothetical protein
MSFEEKPARGVRGCFLYHPFDKDGNFNVNDGSYFFRVYNEDKTYTDYDLWAEEMWVRIESADVSLFKTKNGGCISWSSEMLGRKIAPGEPIRRMKLEKETLPGGGHRPVKDKDGRFVTEEGVYGDDLEFVPIGESS